ncbi:MAG: type I restriction endonuclease [Terriglobia bacterium]
MVRLSSERGVVQSPLIRYATEAGWQYLSPDEALRLRRGENLPLLWEIFLERIQALNPGIVDHLKAEELAKRLCRVRPAVEGNLEAWEYLKGLKTVFVEVERRERNVRLLDFEEPRVNTFYAGGAYITVVVMCASLVRPPWDAVHGKPEDAGGGRVGGEARQQPDFLSPRRTGREDCPHPALAKRVAASNRRPDPPQGSQQAGSHGTACVCRGLFTHRDKPTVNRNATDRGYHRYCNVSG